MMTSKMGLVVITAMVLITCFADAGEIHKDYTQSEVVKCLRLCLSTCPIQISLCYQSCLNICTKKNIAAASAPAASGPAAAISAGGLNGEVEV
ncbi:hypothetical protein ABFS82_04G103200 [Erythranthe guttata]